MVTKHSSLLTNTRQVEGGERREAVPIATLAARYKSLPCGSMRASLIRRLPRCWMSAMRRLNLSNTAEPQMRRNPREDAKTKKPRRSSRCEPMRPSATRLNVQALTLAAKDKEAILLKAGLD